MTTGGDREALSIPDFDDELDDFEPRKPKGQGRASPDARAIDAVSAFPSRESSPDGQLNLKGPRHILERFKAMCKADRRPYYDMLEILMDAHENKR
mgnify:CR=1 FL=1